MGKQLSFSAVTQAIKFALVSIGALVSSDINQEQLHKSVEYSVQQPLLDKSVFLPLSQSISGFTALVEKLRKEGFAYFFAQTVSVNEIESLNDSLQELNDLLNVVERTFGSESREIVKRLKKFNIALQGLYQDVATYMYKQEADAIVLSRLNSDVSNSFDETHSRDDIRRALLG